MVVAVLFTVEIAAQITSFSISFSCVPSHENGFSPSKVEVISHAGTFKITEHSESGKTQSFLLLGETLGSVNQFTFFGTQVALTGPMPKLLEENPNNSKLIIDSGEREIAGMRCISCGENNWCSPSLGPPPAGWPGTNMPLEANIKYGDTSYRVLATSVTTLTDNDFRRSGEYANAFKINKGRTVVDARGFVELFQLSPPTDVIRY
tara:strand:+ start:1370 stop:1987 length:618 start_codon:yes stop_codon:yes gene_type:complete